MEREHRGRSLSRYQHGLGALLSGGGENAEGPQFDLASTTNGGNDWRLVHIRVPNLDPRSVTLTGQGKIDFVDPVHGWINLPVVSSAAFRSGVLLMTENGGKTWQWASGGSGAGGGTVYFVTTTDGWVAGGPDDTKLYATRDGAKSWQEVRLKVPPEVPQGDNPTYDIPIFPDHKHGFLLVTYYSSVGAEAVLVLYSSDDGGRGWKADRVLPKRGDLSGGQKVPSTVADSVLLAAPNSSNGTLPLTADPPGAKASTTVAHISSRGFAVFQLSFTGRSRGWASTSEGLLSTGDGGVTWTDVTPGVRPSGSKRPAGLGDRGSGAQRTQEAAGRVPAAGVPAGSQPDRRVGFDKCAVPTEGQMLNWWPGSPYFDVGIYVGGASLGCSNSGLIPQWVTDVKGYGWGMIPVWSGPQAPCACDHNKPVPSMATLKSLGTTGTAPTTKASSIVMGAS